VTAAQPRPDITMVYPWNDYDGRLSPLKLGVFAALFVPAGWVLVAYGWGMLGARPRLIVVRRMVGVAAFAYVLGHFALYAASEMFDFAKVADEIVLRIYLTIGFAGLLGLAALAATSTDRMIRRLGGRPWQRLHRLIYAIAVLAVIHYCFQAKLDLWQPTVMAGLLFWLLGYRLLLWRFGRRGRLGLRWVATLSLAAGIGTALGEALYFRLAFHADLWRVLETDLSRQTGIRPAVVVVAVGLAITAAGAVRAATARPSPRRLRPARA
jgi:methionine sulfoxide reductase heme-binding subunit